jgi:hypothetical protein
LTDLGVLMHRMGRLAANVSEGTAHSRLDAARQAVLALARSYGTELSTAKAALSCAIRESLAKIVGCASHGPPGLDRAGRRMIAANHCLYLSELTSIRNAIDPWPA